MAKIENKNPQDVLKALLDTEDIPKQDVYMPRFGVHFTVQAIDGKTINRIQEQCTIETRGKNGKVTKSFDEQKLSALIIEKACLVPSWNDQALKDKYNVFEGYEVIERRLLAGELATLSEVIMTISGFGNQEEQIEDAKN